MRRLWEDVGEKSVKLHCMHIILKVNKNKILNTLQQSLNKMKSYLF